MKKIILVLSLFIFLLIGCSKEVDFAKLEQKQGIYYKINDSKPFTGTAVKYFSNGQKEGIANYKNGKLNGEVISYHENGKIQSKSNFVDNMPKGKSILYDEDGSVLFEMEY